MSNSEFWSQFTSAKNEITVLQIVDNLVQHNIPIEGMSIDMTRANEIRVIPGYFFDAMALYADPSSYESIEEMRKDRFFIFYSKKSETVYEYRFYIPGKNTVIRTLCGVPDVMNSIFVDWVDEHTIPEF